MATRNPRQIAAQNIDSERGRHEDGAYPEAPVTMHAPPVRPRIWFANAVTVPFGVVLVSCHCFSISDEYSPLRAALLQRDIVNKVLREASTSRVGDGVHHQPLTMSELKSLVDPGLSLCG